MLARINIMMRGKRNIIRIVQRHLRSTTLHGLRCGMVLLFLFMSFFFAYLSPVYAQQHIVLPFYSSAKGGTSVLLDDVQVTRQADSTLSLQMSFSLLGVRQPAYYATELVPRLFTATDSIDFPAVRLLGRSAYYHDIRSVDAPEESVMEFRDRDAFEPQAYAKQVPYQAWMSGAKLKFVVSALDGCGDVRGYIEKTCPVPNMQASTTTIVTEKHEKVSTTQKTEQFSGRAYISFRVNRTEIDPLYQNNTRELERIRHSLDSLMKQKDVVMKHLSLKGYASPEGYYLVNVRLASGRVHSLRQYLVDSLGLDRNMITVDYEPEDWEGLREYIEKVDWPEREGILDLIDTDMNPDLKLVRIASRYPRRYRYMLDSIFIYLRHTDYTVEYVKAWEEEDRTSTNISDSTSSIVRTDTTYILPEGPMPEITQSRLRRYKPLLAVKTNMLFDAALCPNVELEVPLAHRGPWSRWSVMAEWWFPWWRLDHNPEGDVNKYLRPDQRPTKKSYELLTGGLELRYWMLPRCGGSRPWLTGTFIGLYAAGGKYDFEWKSKGSQGEFVSFGISVGHSWAIARHWNLELSAAAGFIHTPYRYYEAEFDDTHLIYRYTSKKNLIAPTKLKLSLVYILGKRTPQPPLGRVKKGGRP